MNEQSGATVVPVPTRRINRFVVDGVTALKETATEPQPGSKRVVVRICPMPEKDRATNPPPEKPGGEGWLVSPEQQLVCQFKSDKATAHAQWVAVRTYHWSPPRPPVPQTRRRMLRHNAIEAWESMLKTGWRKCSPPVR